MTRGPKGLPVPRVALAGLACLAALAGPGAAQLPEAEDAFNRGDYRTARTLYQQVLATDSLNPRALYRLAIFDSWDGKLKQSLAGFTRLRQVERLDADVMIAHARVLSWNGQLRWSEALYDSVLTIAPDRTDALAGRARAVAWGGDLDRAERLWREALERHPDDAEILTGLAQTLFWKGQPELAESYVARARELTPGDRTVRDVFDQVRAARRPTLSATADYADDRDDNRYIDITASYSASLRPDLRGTLHAVRRRNTDPLRTGLSTGADAFVVRAWGTTGTSLRAGLGARVLDPDSGASHTPLTAQLSVSLRPAKYATVGIGYSRAPFDETALLVQRAFVWDALEAEAELLPRPNLEFSGAASAAWLSDGNRRLLVGLAAMVGVGSGVHVGGYTRFMGYREANPGRGYFAPDLFSLGETRVAYARRWNRWGMRANGGLGLQHVGSGAVTQAEWHAALSISHSWRAIDELALEALYTNSAAARAGTATTEAYRYWSMGLRYRRGL